jgi:hypothetical protein
MINTYYNIMAWTFILFGMVGMATLIGLCFWLINEEINK